MTRQDHASLYLTLYQSRRDLPLEERLIGITEYDEMFPPDSHLDPCLAAVDEAMNQNAVAEHSNAVVQSSLALKDAFLRDEMFDKLDLEKMEEAATRLLFLCSVISGQRTAEIVSLPVRSPRRSA